MVLEHGSYKRLLVFAHEDEAQAFQEYPYLITGIGKVNAVANLASFLAEQEVEEIVVLGTAGIIDDSLNLDTVYRIRGAILHDLEFDPPNATLYPDGSVMMDGTPAGLRKQNVTTTKQGRSLETAQDSSEGFDEPTTIIATGDQFLTDDRVKFRLASQGVGLVDMESYAYTAIAANMGVPIRIYKIPSDFADSETTTETWDSIVEKKSFQLFDFALKRGLL